MSTALLADWIGTDTAHEEKQRESYNINADVVRKVIDVHIGKATEMNRQT
tara:strand:+ start:322 stop:471 length:150 start_codon:yes stop_codon:yes gene_type:complete